MPVTVSYPGVYVEEVPSGVRTITGVATSITAFLGRASQGPIDKAMTLTSFADYLRIFGPVDPSFPLSYSIRDFFGNGGSTAVVVRLFTTIDPDAPPVDNPPPTPTPADWTAKKDLSLAGSDQTVTVLASSPGAWGNLVRINVTPAKLTGLSDQEIKDRFRVDDPKQLFNFEVFLLAAKEELDPDPKKRRSPDETIRNVTINPASLRRLDKVLEAESALVRAKLPSDASLPPPKTDSPVPLEGGKDSLALKTQTPYAGDESKKTGLFALEDVDLFNLLCVPPDKLGTNLFASSAAVRAWHDVALAYCERRRAFYLIDGLTEWDESPTALVRAPDPSAKLGEAVNPNKFGAIYFPRLEQVDSLQSNRKIKVSAVGTIAGIYARTDADRGVWKAPAGQDATLRGASGLAFKLTDVENGFLNPLGLNCLRTFPAAGSVVWGARTLRGADRLADADNRYVPVRRLTLFIEESLYRGTQFAVFEPNGPVLWGQLRLAIGSFMQNLFNQGAFAGKTASDAFFVKCDDKTTTQVEIDLGKVVVDVGFAPLKPAEFVILRIQQMAGQSPA
jgi:phage tail sheath protein FI